MAVRGRFCATKEAVGAFVEIALYDNIMPNDVTFQVYTPTSAFVGSVPGAVLSQRRGTLQQVHKPAGYPPRSSSKARKIASTVSQLQEDSGTRQPLKLVAEARARQKGVGNTCFDRIVFIEHTRRSTHRQPLSR